MHPDSQFLPRELCALLLFLAAFTLNRANAARRAAGAEKAPPPVVRCFECNDTIAECPVTDNVKSAVCGACYTITYRKYVDAQLDLSKIEQNRDALEFELANCRDGL